MSITVAMRGLFRYLQNEMVADQLIKEHRTAVREATKKIPTLLGRQLSLLRRESLVCQEATLPGR